MARWLIKVSGMLMPLYSLLQKKLLVAEYLQMDKTLGPKFLKKMETRQQVRAICGLGINR